MKKSVLALLMSVMDSEERLDAADEEVEESVLVEVWLDMINSAAGRGLVDASGRSGVEEGWAAAAPWHLAACLFSLVESQKPCPQKAHSNFDFPTSRGCLFSICRLRLPDLGKSNEQYGQA